MASSKRILVESFKYLTLTSKILIAAENWLEIDSHDKIMVVATAVEGHVMLVHNLEGSPDEILNCPPYTESKEWPKKETGCVGGKR